MSAPVLATMALFRKAVIQNAMRKSVANGSEWLLMGNSSGIHFIYVLLSLFKFFVIGHTEVCPTDYHLMCSRLSFFTMISNHSSVFFPSYP